MSTIQVDEADTPEVKTWLMNRLEDISDADTDVLADYVIALVKSDEPEETIRANCVENLEDFLHGHSQGFVTDVFQAIRSKSFKPGYKPPPSKPTVLPGLNASAPSYQPPTASTTAQGLPTGPAGQPQPSLGTSPQQTEGQAAQSKKRSFNESHADGQGPPQGPGGERAMKQMKRGGQDGRGRGGRGGRGGSGFPQQQTQTQQPPQGFPQFDPNNPMASLMAMQAMGFPMPGLEQIPGMQQPQQPQQQHSRKRGRCRDYDNKGYCARGSTCPYEHGADHIVVPETYDPANASMGFPLPNQQPPPSTFAPPPTRGSNHPRARSSTRGDHTARGRGTQSRSSISALGPSTSSSNTSIVVEQIPTDKFNTEAITAFFAEFGTISKIDLQEHKKLAVINFEDHDSAQRAYESPKVIFGNRFVKVYWYKPEREDQLQPSTRTSVEGRAQSRSRSQRASSSQAGDTNMSGTSAEEPKISPEEFAKKQEEAQRAYEEKVKKMKEAEEAKNELDRKIKAQAEERKKLLEKLEAKSKTGAASPAPVVKDGTPGPQNGQTKGSDAKAKQTEALREKLAALEAEATAMGIPSDDTSQPGYAPFGRGGYGGYGGFRGRGRGAYGAYAPRGRGGYGGWAGGSVARLDNRPKMVAVKALEEGKDLGSQEADESLRAFLYGIGAFSSITKPNDSDPSTIHVAFNERYIAEMFMNAGSSPLPGIGKVEMSWVANQPASRTATNGHATNGAEQKKPGADTEMGDGGGGVAGAQTKAEEVDYDVADEMDEYR